MLIVQKFGGSSIADGDRLRRAAGICMRQRQNGNEVVVVVSAMGDTTDLLADRARVLGGKPSPREMDALITTGEQQSAALLVMTMESLGMPAVSLAGWQAGIYTDCRYGDSDIRLIAPVRIREALSRGRVPVVTGFQGVCAAGDITSLGRGGSDTTAVALAAALESDCCEIYTDVDGIYTADPRLIPDAVKLDAIDYRDMIALAEAGSQVLHAKSVELAMANSVVIHLLSSFTDAPGSQVRALRDGSRPDLAGITRSRASGEISLAGKAADAAALSRAVLLLAAEGIEVLSGSAGSGRISVLVEEAEQPRAMQLLHREMIVKALK